MQYMNNTQAFTFYRNYYEIIKYLPPKEKIQLYDAILEYMFEDKEPQLKDLLNGIWVNIKRPLDNNKKNIENGSKGGRPKIEKEEPKKNPKKTQKKPKEEPKPKANNISYFLFLFSNIYISNLDNKDSIYKLLEEYLDIRIKNKYVVNETVVKRLINKLNEYGLNDGEKIMVIENAINGKWKDFYPLKEHNPEWFDKELTNDPMSEEDKQEVDNMLENIEKMMENL